MDKTIAHCRNAVASLTGANYGVLPIVNDLGRRLTQAGKSTLFLQDAAFWSMPADF